LQFSWLFSPHQVIGCLIKSVFLLVLLPTAQVSLLELETQSVKQLLNQQLTRAIAKTGFISVFTHVPIHTFIPQIEQ